MFLYLRKLVTKSGKIIEQDRHDGYVRVDEFLIKSYPDHDKKLISMKLIEMCYKPEFYCIIDLKFNESEKTFELVRRNQFIGGEFEYLIDLTKFVPIYEELHKKYRTIAYSPNYRFNYEDKDDVIQFYDNLTLGPRITRTSELKYANWEKSPIYGISIPCEMFIEFVKNNFNEIYDEVQSLNLLDYKIHESWRFSDDEIIIFIDDGYIKYNKDGIMTISYNDEIISTPKIDKEWINKNLTDNAQLLAMEIFQYIEHDRDFDDIRLLVDDIFTV